MDLANYQHQDCGDHNANSGLLRFRSAPSSVLTENSESERLLSQFVPGKEDSTSLLHFHDFGGKSASAASNTKSNNSNGARISRNEYTLFSSAMNCRSELPPQYPKQSQGSLSSTRAKNLVRQSSSPAGFLSEFTVQKGYTAVRGVEMSSSPSSSGVPSPTLGLLSRISEIGKEGITENNHDGEKFANSDPRSYGSMFPVDSWNHSAHFVQSDGKLFSGLQNRQEGNLPHTLSHHLSLPKPSAENMEKLLQFQDSVPCKIRAKRGCATHPRSIAERVRRTRISERMRKLQDLVPNMDKQTNTADMLDLAVDYIKDLQRQFKVLTDVRAQCKCKSSQQIC